MTTGTHVSPATEAYADALAYAGLSRDEVGRWLESAPNLPDPEDVSPENLARDTAAAARFFSLGTDLLLRLRPKPERSEAEQMAAERLQEPLREARTRFMRTYSGLVYASLTDSYRTFVRVEDLTYLAAERYPGLTPARDRVQAELQRPLKDQDGVQLDQGLFLSQVFAHARAGAHLIHAMMRPKPESLELLDAFCRDGAADLGTAYIERKGQAAYLQLRNTGSLNAEDDTTAGPMEIGADLALLDPQVEVGVLRGAPVEHPRYAGRRVFTSGLNLMRLYQGRLPFMFYFERDLGFVNKLYRGQTGLEFLPGQPEDTHEKPWLGAVETFAIGGGCQLLLVLDRVMAEAGSYFNLPARKEGIIPGVSNLRLTRSVGDRLARQLILFGLDIQADSPEGRLLVDEIVPEGGDMDATITRTVQALTGSGLISAAANRKALRIAQEPLVDFQAYMATYAREQAYCHFSPALVRNLEEFWSSRNKLPSA